MQCKNHMDITTINQTKIGLQIDGSTKIKPKINIIKKKILENIPALQDGGGSEWTRERQIGVSRFNDGGKGTTGLRRGTTGCNLFPSSWVIDLERGRESVGAWWNFFSTSLDHQSRDIQWNDIRRSVWFEMESHPTTERYGPLWEEREDRGRGEWKGWMISKELDDKITLFIVKL